MGHGVIAISVTRQLTYTHGPMLSFMLVATMADKLKGDVCDVREMFGSCLLNLICRNDWQPIIFWLVLAG
jgi:hypothetical protein